MYDHILMFNSESLAHESLSSFGYSKLDTWNASCVLPGIELVLADEVWDTTDPWRPVLVTPKQVVPGFYIVISLNTISEDLKNLPNSACRLIASSELALLNKPFLVWTATNINPTILDTIIRIEPSLSGRYYDFSNLGSKIWKH